MFKDSQLATILINLLSEHIAISFFIFISIILAGAFGFLHSNVIYKRKAQKEIEGAVSNLKERNRALSATYRLYEIILESPKFKEMAQKIANVIPQKLGYETGVLALIDKKENLLKRVAISETVGGRAALKSLPIPFKKIIIPMNQKQNFCIKAMDQDRQLVTHNLYDLLRPAVDKESSKKVQETMGTTTSIVSPLKASGKTIGVFIVSMSKSENQLSSYEKEMVRRFTEGVGVALDFAQLYDNLSKTSQKLKSANERLTILDKEKDDFISITSHELKTPITAMSANLWLFQHLMKNNVPAKQKEILERTLANLKRLTKLINNLLDVSRIQQGRLVLNVTKSNLDEIVKSVIADFKQTTKNKGLDIMYSKEKIGDVYIDKDRVKEVLENFISNAIKYADKGSVEINLKEEDDKIIIKVKNSGPGIKEKDKEKIFTKFGRAYEGLKAIGSDSSTGLGLYISKSIIKEMGGEVWFNSKPNNKTSFYFTIPKKMTLA